MAHEMSKVVYNDGSKGIILSKNEVLQAIVLSQNPAWFNKVAQFGAFSKELMDYSYNGARNDPYLVKIVEDRKPDDPMHRGNSLKIAEIPVGTKYTIMVIDGVERLVTIDSLAWDTA